MSLEPITDTARLASLCEDLSKGAFVTVDTEFIREKTYWPQLCLVQLAGPVPGDEGGDEAGEDGPEGIIDTLAPDIDLQPLFDLLADKSILKVFHAARQDLEIFYHLTGEVPEPVFDTQVAAMVCGLGDQIGYEGIVRKLLGREVDKGSRFTDWAARPLTERQRSYALSDVTHLRDVYRKVAARLDKNGRAGWLQEEMAILTATDTYRNDPKNAWRRIKARNPKPRLLAVLKTIAAWREQEAQDRDLPRGRILKDESLLEVANSAPRNARDLERIRGVSNGFANGKIGRGLLEAVEAGLNAPVEKQRERRPSPPPTGLGAITDLLKVLLKHRCDEAGVASRLVANAEDLERLAADDEADIAANRGWRREMFGAEAVDLKHGRIALSVSGKSVRLIKLDQDGQLVSSNGGDNKNNAEEKA